MKVENKTNTIIYAEVGEEQFIASYESITEAAKKVEKATVKGISKCCRGGCKTHIGYIWKYK